MSSSSSSSSSFSSTSPPAAPTQHKPPVKPPERAREPDRGPAHAVPTPGPAPASASAFTLPRLCPHSALFLDFDGTLVDIAAQPERITLAPGLVDMLRRLSAHLQGALALVSGRTIAELDAYLAPLVLPCAAEHGAVLRLAQGQVCTATPLPFQNVLDAASRLVAQHPGLRLERKSHGLALHYRQVPALQSLCLRVMREAVHPTSGLTLLQGKCVLEAKPTGTSKGAAIEAFMAQTPFAGRSPVFAGDDSTDESGFIAMPRLGGKAIKVGPGPSAAPHRCASPARLRQWLASSLQGLDA